MSKSHNPRFLKLVEIAKGPIREVTVSELTARQQAAPSDLVVVDVREDREWSKGYIRGAVHMGKGILERDAEKTWPDLRTEIVLYCGGGFRSALAAEALQNMGYTRVSSLAGGWRAWNAINAPTSIPDS